MIFILNCSESFLDEKDVEVIRCETSHVCEALCSQQNKSSNADGNNLNVSYYSGVEIT